MKYDLTNCLILGGGKTATSLSSYFDNHHIKYERTEIYDPRSDLESFSLVVKSPGLFPNLPLVKQCQGQVPIIGDLELFYHLNPQVKIIAVTGTNGKTTLVSMVHHMLSQSGVKCLVGGNIGIPLMSLDVSDCEFVIIEASSFMLADTVTFRPNIAIITNISHHHLDYHSDFEKYVSAKEKIIVNQTESDYLLTTQEVVETFAMTLKSNLSIVKATLPPFIDPSWMNQGNRINYAICHQLLTILGYPLRYLDTLETFIFLPYRLELNKKIMNDYGITIFNDSKSTTLASTNHAIRSMDHSKKIWLILGGKKEEVVEEIELDAVERVYLFGEMRHELFQKVGNKGIICDDFELMVRCIVSDIVDLSTQILFSPGFQSYDLFMGFVDRGENFNRLIDENLSRRFVSLANNK